MTLAAVRMAGLEIVARRRRILALLAFAALFLAAALTAAAVAGEEGHVEMDRLFQVGGYPLISSVLLAGWLLGRFPLVATLVLLSGVVAGDRAEGHARILASRPGSPAVLYGVRFLALAGIAFVLSAALMPAFDLIVLGEWAGPATFVLILANVLVWGGLTTLLSVVTRLDAWVVLMLALLAMVWSSLIAAGMMPLAPPLAELVGFVLPPHSQMLRLEAAFADLEPIPWDAFLFCAGYGAATLLAAGLLLRRREI